MFIGSLINENAKTNISYCYKRADTNEIYNPDRIKEAQNKEAYSVDGALFKGQIAFDGTALVDSAVDIKIDLGRECYVDMLTFSQGEKSAISKALVLAEKDGKINPVGVTNAETGKFLDGDVTVNVGVFTDNLIIRLEASFEDISIGELDILGATDLQKAVYPIPLEMTEKSAYLKTITGICTQNDDEKFAGSYFAERYEEDFGKTVPLSNGNVTFALDMQMKEEQLEISVTENEAIVKAGSRRALVYAASKLLQLCTEDGIRCASVKDEPFMTLRGVHFALPAREKIEFVKRMVKYVFAPLGYNMVILQLSGAMEYKRHPEFNEQWAKSCKMYEEGKWPIPAHYNFVGHDILSQEEVVDLCDYIRSFGLELVPEVQTLGHVQYITSAYPEMGEVEKKKESVDLYSADERPDEFYIHSMCPNHPKYYDIIFDIIDEVIEVLKPQNYLHIGHDEVYTIGKCDICKDIPKHEIYATEVTNLYNHIKSKGLKTMMWSDMIQESYSPAREAINLIPKDILCLSFTWYFHMDEDVENDLYDHGFDVVIGNFYSSHYRRFDKRKYGKTLIGAEISTWVPCNELYYGYEGKMYDFIYSANMLWNENSRQEMRNTYGEIVNRVAHNARKYIMGTVMGDSAKSVSFEKCADNVPCDIRNDYACAALIKQGTQMEIQINSKVNKLSFLHAADGHGRRVMWDRAKVMGVYTAEYDDGTKEDVEIYYGAHIYRYDRKYALPLEGAIFRHEGYPATFLCEPFMKKTFDGRDYTLYNYTWVNPNPEKTLTKVTLKNIYDMNVGILLFDVKAE